MTSLILEQSPRHRREQSRWLAAGCAGRTSLAWSALDLASNELTGGDSDHRSGRLTKLHGLDLSGNLLAGRHSPSAGEPDQSHRRARLAQQSVDRGLPPSLTNLNECATSWIWEATPLPASIVSGGRNACICVRSTSGRMGSAGRCPASSAACRSCIGLTCRRTTSAGTSGAGFGDAPSLDDIDLSENNFLVRVQQRVHQHLDPDRAGSVVQL